MARFKIRSLNWGVSRFIFLGIVVLLSTDGRAEDTKTSFDPSYRQMLDAWLTARIETLDIPGLAVAVVNDSGVIYQGCFGYADVGKREPVLPKTRFRIASQSKVFTALAVMQLRDEKKLRLDDSIGKYLPWAKFRNVDGSDAEITIGQLLTHTSGASSIAFHARPIWTEYQFPNSEELRNEVDGQDLLYQPGERWKYSNLGFSLLGQIVQVVTEQRFDQYVKQRVLTPLGLDSTEVAITNNAANMATGYEPFRKDGFVPIPFVDAKAMAPAMGIASSIEDMASFAAWQLRQRKDEVNTVIVSASTLREMQRPHRTLDDWSYGQGLGFCVSVKDNGALIGHGGQNPGFFTETLIDPSKNLGVVVLCNGMQWAVYTGQPNSIIDALFHTANFALSDDRELKKGDADWKKYFGQYQGIWGRIHVMSSRGELTAFYLDDAIPTKRLYRLEALSAGKHRFRAVHSDDPFYIREVFSFHDFDAGKAMTFRDPGADFARVKE